MNRNLGLFLALVAGVAVYTLTLPRPDGASPVPPSVSRDPLGSAPANAARKPSLRRPGPRATPPNESKPEATVGKFLDAAGPACPFDSNVEVTCDLPAELRLRNTGGMGPGGPGTGAGLCVFTSIEHAANYQNEPRLAGFQKKMTREPGGGSPGKVDQMIGKYAPGTTYIQHTSGDVDFLKAVLKTGRMPCITYAGRDPFYKKLVYHMVNLVYLDDQYAAILDNNRPNVIVWMTAQELVDRWRDAQGGWAVALLAPRPPPAPRN